LPGTLQLQCVQTDLHNLTIQVRRRSVFGEDRDRLRTLRLRLHDLNGLAPRRPLAVVDLSQVQHMPLHDPSSGATPVLDNAPVTVFLAVLDAGADV